MYNQLRSSIMPFTWKNMQRTQDREARPHFTRQIYLAFAFKS